MRRGAARTAGPLLPGTAVAGSVALHGLVLAAAMLAARTGPPRRAALPAYRVELRAAPAGGGTVDRGTVAPPTPTPTSAPAPRPSPPRPAATPARPSTPARQPEAAPTVPRSPGATVPPAASATPGPPAAGTGTDAANIRTEGVEFPFPGYLRNLVSQVYRRWQPPAGRADLEAEVMFLVRRDGSIDGLQFTKRSGSFGFDLEAQGAVEAAARAGAFGPLPAGYGADVLPVSFFFRPGR